MFSAKNLDLDSFALGLFIGVVVMSILYAGFFAQRNTSVPADFYTCTYSALDPQSELLKGVFCREGNVSTDPCPFDIKTDFVGRFYVNKKEIDRVNDFNSKNPNGQRGKWNITITEQ